MTDEAQQRAWQALVEVMQTDLANRFLVVAMRGHQPDGRVDVHVAREDASRFIERSDYRFRTNAQALPGTYSWVFAGQRLFRHGKLWLPFRPERSPS
ncbi:MAG: hypothetical protein IT340_20145 [Chloroflexi bacterium]|nr:hypothetical protein [Chloroflexota bacterium]